MAKLVTFLIMSLNILQVITMINCQSSNHRPYSNNHNKMEDECNSKNCITDPLDLFNYIRPISYDIKLILLDNDNFYGETNISLNITKYTKNISFHSDCLGINHQAITLTTGINGTIYIPFDYTYDIESQVNNIYFNHLLPPTQYHIFIKYTGIINNNPNDKQGLYKSSYITHEGEKVWSFSTFIRGNGARRIFPCWDKPPLKATFKLTIEHSKYYEALSNVPLIRRVDSDSNIMAWSYFNVSHKMSAYHVTLVLYNYTSFHAADDQDNKIAILYPMFVDDEDIEYAMHVAESVILYLQTSEISAWLPVAQMIHIAIPNYPTDVDNNALAFHRVADLTYNQKVDSINQKVEVARSVSRKVAFYWLSNAFSPVTWSYLWITQGLCTLLGMHALAQKYLELEIMDFSIVQMKHDSLHLDTHFIMNPLVMDISPNQIESLFSYQYYLKAFLIMHMIENIMTEKIFWKNVKEYLNERSKTDEGPFLNFLNYTQDAIKNSNISDIEPLREAMYVWATSSGYPVLNVTRNYQTGNITIQVLSNANASNSNYIYVSYATETFPEFIHHESIYKAGWITPCNRNYTIATNIDDWIIVNIRQIGYYRVLYDKRNWKRLIRYLKRCDFEKIHVLNRAQLVDDAFHFVTEGHLDFSLFMSLTEYLGINEKDYVAWYPMIKVFEYVSGFLPYSASIELRIHISHILIQLIQRIKFEKQPYESEFTECLRQEAIKWGSVVNNINFHKEATRELKNYLILRERYKFLPGLKEWTFCNGLKHANFIVWYKIFDIWREKRDKNFLRYLACSKNTEIINSYLKLPMSDSNITEMQPIDHANSFLYIVVRNARNERVLQFILDNFENVKPKQINVAMAFNVLINYVYSKKQLNLLKVAAKTYSITEEEFEKIYWKIKRREYQIETLTANFYKFITQQGRHMY